MLINPRSLLLQEFYRRIHQFENSDLHHVPDDEFLTFIGELNSIRAAIVALQDMPDILVSIDCETKDVTSRLPDIS